MRQRRTLYRRVAGVRVNNLPQSDPESAQRLWRNLTSGSGIATVPIKTTPTRVSDFIGFDGTETSFIPLRSWHRAQQPPAIRSRIGPAAVEESPIEFWDCQGTYKDNPHKGQRFHEFRCDRDVLYTAALLASRPTTCRNRIEDWLSSCGGICHRVLGSPASHPIQPCDFMNNSPMGMNLIPLDSWHRAQEPPCVGFRIDCGAVVECCSCEP